MNKFFEGFEKIAKLARPAINWDPYFKPIVAAKKKVKIKAKSKPKPAPGTLDYSSGAPVWT